MYRVHIYFFLRKDTRKTYYNRIESMPIDIYEVIKLQKNYLPLFSFCDNMIPATVS
jgi:hypothetical protein